MAGFSRLSRVTTDFYEQRPAFMRCQAEIVSDMVGADLVRLRLEGKTRRSAPLVEADIGEKDTILLDDGGKMAPSSRPDRSSNFEQIGKIGSERNLDTNELRPVVKIPYREPLVTVSIPEEARPAGE